MQCFDRVYVRLLTIFYGLFLSRMKSYIGLALALAAIFVVAHSKSYTSSIGYYEGSSLRFWDFGATTNGNSATARSYSINVVLPNTTGNSDDGSTAEIQDLLCSNVSCPNVVRSHPFSRGCFWASVTLFLPDLPRFRGIEAACILSATYAVLHMEHGACETGFTAHTILEPLLFFFGTLRSPSKFPRALI